MRESTEKKVLWKIFKAIMIEQFVTPSESHLREKPFSRNAEQVHSPLISLLLGGCRGICSYVFDIEAHVQHVRMCGRSTDTGVQIYRYGRSTFLLRAC